MNSTVTGSCGSTNSTMELTWFEKSESYNVYKNEKNNSFKINFQKDESNYLLHSIELNIYMDKTNFPNSDGKSFFCLPIYKKKFVFWGRDKIIIIIISFFLIQKRDTPLSKISIWFPLLWTISTNAVTIPL